MTESALGEAHSLFNRRKDTSMLKILRDHSHFPEPGRGRGNGL
jgi:hypothetical protein